VKLFQTKFVYISFFILVGFFPSDPSENDFLFFSYFNTKFRSKLSLILHLIGCGIILIGEIGLSPVIQYYLKQECNKEYIPYSMYIMILFLIIFLFLQIFIRCVSSKNKYWIIHYTSLYCELIIFILIATNEIHLTTIISYNIYCI